MGFWKSTPPRIIQGPWKTGTVCKPCKEVIHWHNKCCPTCGSRKFDEVVYREVYEETGGFFDRQLGIEIKEEP